MIAWLMIAKRKALGYCQSKNKLMIVWLMTAKRKTLGYC